MSELEVKELMNSVTVENNFKKWLYKVTWWKVQDYIKGKSKITTEPFDDKTERDSQKSNAEYKVAIHEDMEVKELRQILSKALAHLNSEERIVLTLHYFEGLSYREIAVLQSEAKLDENELRKETNRLRKISERACTKLKKIIEKNPQYGEFLAP